MPYRKQSAFTLIELLVVIGIIALLMAILLPALNRVKEKSRQVQCLSNVRQLGTAYVMYLNANKGYFPRSAPHTAASYQDWIYWWPTGNPNYQMADQSGVGRYLGVSYSNPQVLQCPSDTDAENRLALVRAGTKKFPFSYVQNRNFQSGWPDGASGEGTDWKTYKKITSVSNPSEKVLAYEESEQTIDDGSGNAYEKGNFDWVNLLSGRHDKSKLRQPEGILGSRSPDVPNWEVRGNALFCDGHAEFISRRYLFSWEHAMGDRLFMVNPTYP